MLSINLTSIQNHVLTFVAYFPQTFEPTPSPELDQLLETIRRKVILPRHLVGDNRKLVSNPERSKALLTEDIRIRIGDQEERLEPIDFSKDGVSHHNTFREVLHLSTKTGDFSFWARLLQGYDGAGIKLNATQQEQLIRKACDTGHVGLVLSILNAVKHTNLFPSSLTVFKIPSAIRHQALFADQLQLAKDTLLEANPATLQSILNAIELGESTDDLLDEVPGVGAIRVQALHKGLRRAVQFNLILAKPEVLKRLQHRRLTTRHPIHQKTKETSTESSGSDATNSVSNASLVPLAYQSTFSLNDPILAATPLELQSKIEWLLTKDPSALDKAVNETKEDSTAPLVPGVSAADYTVRLLDTLAKEPITKVRHPIILRDEHLVDKQTNKEYQESAPLRTDKTGLSISERRNLFARQNEWLSRAIAVASSLRAASVVVTDKSLLCNANEHRQEIEAAIQEAMPKFGDTINGRAITVPSHLLDAAKQYQEGVREWGIHGKMTQPQNLPKLDL